MLKTTVLSYTGVFSVTGRSCTIEVLEVDMQVLKSSSEGLLWPRNLPKPDGVMIWCVIGLPKTACSPLYGFGSHRTPGPSPLGLP